MSDFETLNCGEWSEVYAFLKELEMGKLQGCNHTLDIIENEVCTIVNIYKKQNQSGKDIIYHTNGKNIEVICNGKIKKQFPKKTLHNLLNILLKQIQGNKKRTFCVPEIQKFLTEIYSPKIKASSYEKKDISLSVIEPASKTEHQFGFSIKSNLCKANSTLLNASKATNFVYVIEDNSFLDTSLKTKKLLKSINKIKFEKLDSPIFDTNLQIIDTQFPIIIAKMLLYYYQGKGTKLEELIECIKEENPLNLTDKSIYRIKVGEFLLSIALGMFPNTEWNRIYDSDGGMLVIREDGEIVSFYIFKQKLLEELKEYLIINSYLDTPSTSRHAFGKLYKEGTKNKLKLNLQIRLYPH